jgi:hypothetical protein
VGQMDAAFAGRIEPFWPEQWLTVAVLDVFLF